MIHTRPAPVQPLARVAAALALVVWISASPAQPDETPSQTLDEQMEEAERLVPREPGEIEAFSPAEEDRTEAVRPGLTEGVDWLAALDSAWGSPAGSGLLPERSFVNHVRGRVRRGPYETLIFIPDPDDPLTLVPPGSTMSGTGSGAGDPTPSDAEPSTDPAPGFAKPIVPTRAVLLLPSGVLERFSEYALGNEQETGAILTGQVFLYNQRNYILPVMLQRAHPEPGSTPADQTEATGSGDADRPAGTPRDARAGDALGDDPDTDALIAELQRHPPFAPPPSTAVDRRADVPSEADVPSASQGEADGEYIAARRGRLIRANDGTWSFVVDTDDPSYTLSYTLLPCRTLQGIEGIGLTHGDSAAGEISGRVYRFHGRAFLLPTLYQRDHRGGVNPLQ